MYADCSLVATYRHIENYASIFGFIYTVHFRIQNGAEYQRKGEKVSEWKDRLKDIRKGTQNKKEKTE